MGYPLKNCSSNQYVYRMAATEAGWKYELSMSVFTPIKIYIGLGMSTSDNCLFGWLCLRVIMFNYMYTNKSFNPIVVNVAINECFV